MERKTIVVLATAGLLASTVGARPAAAQQTKKPANSGLFSGWEIEAHAGGSASSVSKGGLSLPEPGGGFLTFNGFQTRQVRSWFFGDGAILMNQNLASSNFTPRITPLDPILNASSVSTGSPFGVRLTRGLTERMGFEFSLDTLGARKLTDEAREGAEATRASFVNAWNARTASMVGRTIFANLDATHGGRQILATGALTFSLPGRGRLSPYAVVGGGLWTAVGAGPTISLEGDYLFVSGSLTPYRQTDEVDIEFRSGTSFATLLGAGFRYAINDRSGLRVDFRGHFAPDPTEVVVNWRPTTIPGSPANTIFLAGTPAIQVSNGSLQSTLSLTQGDPDYVIASADGVRKLMNFTVGYYYRFGSGTVATRTTPTSQARRSEGKEIWQSNKRWEVDAHVGGMFGGVGSGGTAGTFPPGVPFTASSARPSRYVSSWMFGDGAVLINEQAAGFVGAIPVADRMSSLNPMLTKSSLERSSGGSIGARVSRRLTRRVRAQFAVTSASRSYGFTEDALTQIERTRASFAPVWNGIIGTGGGVVFTNAQVSASANITDTVSGWETAVTGGLEMQLWTSRRAIAYTTVGVGVLNRPSASPEATLTGSYQFMFAGVAPLSERDVVRIHYDAGGASPVFVFGGGTKYFLSATRGIRADFEIHVAGNSVDTLVDATPSMTPGTPTFSISSLTTPAVVFSNTPAQRGNLTGPAIRDLRTFTGSGRSAVVSVTAGYFWRF